MMFHLKKMLVFLVLFMSVHDRIRLSHFMLSVEAELNSLLGREVALTYKALPGHKPPTPRSEIADRVMDYLDSPR